MHERARSIPRASTHSHIQILLLSLPPPSLSLSHTNTHTHTSHHMRASQVLVYTSVPEALQGALKANEWSSATLAEVRAVACIH